MPYFDNPSTVSFFHQAIYKSRAPVVVLQLVSVPTELSTKREGDKSQFHSFFLFSSLEYLLSYLPYILLYISDMPQWTGFYKSNGNSNNADTKTAIVSPTPQVKKLSAVKSSASLSNGRSSPSLRSLSRLSLRSSPGADHESAEDAAMMADIAQVRKALDCFFDSRISDAEAILAPRRKKSMYYSLGYGFILFLKCVMTFEQADIERTLEALKQTIQLAHAQRKKDAGWLDNITTWMKGTNVQQLKAMTRVHRHAVSLFGGEDV